MHSMTELCLWGNTLATASIVTKDNMAISFSVLFHQSVTESNICVEMNIVFTVASNGELINRTPKYRLVKPNL